MKEPLQQIQTSFCSANSPILSSPQHLQQLVHRFPATIRRHWRWVIKEHISHTASVVGKLWACHLSGSCLHRACALTETECSSEYEFRSPISPLSAKARRTKKQSQIAEQQGFERLHTGLSSRVFTLPSELWSACVFTHENQRPSLIWAVLSSWAD